MLFRSYLLLCIAWRAFVLMCSACTHFTTVEFFVNLLLHCIDVFENIFGAPTTLPRLSFQFFFPRSPRYSDFKRLGSNNSNSSQVPHVRRVLTKDGGFLGERQIWGKKRQGILGAASFELQVLCAETPNINQECYKVRESTKIWTHKKSNGEMLLCRRESSASHAGFLGRGERLLQH